MRISSISVAQPRTTNYNFRRQNVQAPVINNSPSFNGSGGAVGTLFGSLLGIGLTAISGGALAWTIPMLGGVGGIGGDIYEKKDKPSTDSYGQDLYD